MYSIEGMNWKTSDCVEVNSRGGCWTWLILTWNGLSGPVHTAPFLYKNGEKSLRFCESGHIDPHKNATITEVSKTLSKVDIHKNGAFWKRSRSMWTHKNGGFWKRPNIEQWATQNQSNVNAQKRMLFAAFLLSGRSMWTHKSGGFSRCFCTKIEQCERVSSMQRKRKLTKTKQCEQGLTLGTRASKFKWKEIGKRRKNVFPSLFFSFYYFLALVPRVTGPQHPSVSNFRRVYSWVFCFP